jgi:hypothetical protein
VAARLIVSERQEISASVYVDVADATPQDVRGSIGSYDAGIACLPATR